MEDGPVRDDVPVIPTGAPGRTTASGFMRKAGIGAVGGTVTAAGLVMLVTPGPGLLVTVAGLGILAKEFPAARRLLQRGRPGRSVSATPDEENE